MIEFNTTVHRTVHVRAVVSAEELPKVTRKIAAGARHHGATGPALRRTEEVTPDGLTVLRIAYRLA